MKISDIASKNFLIYSDYANISEIISASELVDKDFLIIMGEAGIKRVFSINTILKQLLLGHNNRTLFEAINEEDFVTVNSNSSIIDILELEANIIIVAEDNGQPVGIINNLETIKKFQALSNTYIKNINNKLYIYEKIFECFEEEIFLADEKGNILRINPEAERVMGIRASDVVGKHVTELVNDRIISSSTTVEVLKQNKKVNMLQTVRNGSTRLSTGVPIYDDDNQIQFVLCTSKDVTELVELRKDIEEKELKLKQINKELDLLQEEVFAQVNFVSKSREMDYIKQTIKKIVNMDLTVLVLGETGVGKEVIAKTIHYLSNRKNSSFVKINCGLIPHNLLDSELFGYESGAFTGANKSGKIGKIELAHKGTLFLDEIGEMPYDLQVKLLDFLQDNHIIRVGGTERIKIDARIIAATNRDLQHMVKEGTFRKDLFYRLNIIPINVPPLKERLDDLPVLVEFFLKKINIRYQMNKRLDPLVINEFIKYDWPGNVRELEHLLERMLIMSDTDTIYPKHFHNIINIKSDSVSGKVICTDLIPYKKAKRELEKQLIVKAYEIYQSTYKAAKALEIDQSTVVKILQKHKDNS
ncbi:MAG: sigma 54-interacting transcriptional regulator [Clostridia bacterium]|nr:sigma 54-interacting transcriptional regulator [Clostridia bacterium]